MLKGWEGGAHRVGRWCALGGKVVLKGWEGGAQRVGRLFNLKIFFVQFSTCHKVQFKSQCLECNKLPDYRVQLNIQALKNM